ncbi:organic hydroperoxide resistance protein [Chryseobacterium daeguense]|uniref:organic hydroperoxide resistance protein n=1 Tax=Chryseobacterium daeguense TaxID=412438 RepID=UPI001E5843CE|nr:organic hydroperoxide resistance protein [Chryseobacterium daeguense]
MQGRRIQQGGREGFSKSSDGNLNIKLSTPGGNEQGTNPEQLFAAGWSACFIGALGIAARKRKIRLSQDTAVDAEVDLCMDDDAYFLQARLNVSLPGIDNKTAKILTEEAHQTCPYSKMFRGNINVEINIV